MKRFLQLHLLTSYPPANLNRDDLGRPKTAFMGGATRLRVSSQSLKRAWRTSESFEAAVGEHKGIRTKSMGQEILKKLTDRGTGEKDARVFARSIVAKFGKLEKSKDDGKKTGLQIAQLAHFAPEEQAAINALVEQLAERGSAPKEAELDLLRKDIRAADIALFGRMLADSPSHNVEAAAQVAHAITVHKTAVEDDFFTAVDDLNTDEDTGAGHMGETEFGAGLFYLYLCVDRQLLLANLQGYEALCKKTLAALVEAAATVSPSGKQNSFASRARASYVLSETGNEQPRTLAGAFLRPVTEHEAQGDMLAAAVERLTGKRNPSGSVSPVNQALETPAEEKETEERKPGVNRPVRDLVRRMDKAYGPCAHERRVMNLLTGEGTLKDVIEHATR